MLTRKWQIKSLLPAELKILFLISGMLLQVIAFSEPWEVSGRKEKQEQFVSI